MKQNIICIILIASLFLSVIPQGLFPVAAAQEKEEAAYFNSLDNTQMQSALLLNTETQTDSEVSISTGGEHAYFKFSPSASGKYMFEASGNFDTIGYLYDSSGNLLSSDDDNGDGRNFSISYYFTEGQIYYMDVKMYSAAATGKFDVYLRRLLTVSYDASNGTGAPEDEFVPFGDYFSISQTTPISNDGDAFLNWSYDENVFYDTGSFIKLTDSHTFSANYQIDSGLIIGPSISTYTIKFDSNGGYGQHSNVILIPVVGAATYWTVPEFIPFRFPYNFKGWAFSQDSVSAELLPNETTDNYSNTLYAVWENPTVLSYNNMITSNAVITVAGTEKYFSFTPSQSGIYTFESTDTADTYCRVYNTSGTQLAFDDNDGLSANGFKLSYYFKAGTTYYLSVNFADNTKTGIIPVKLAKEHTITYDYQSNGGSSATKASASVLSGDMADLTPSATKSGWIFVGWNTDKDAKTALSEYTVTNDTTLYAIYKKTLTATFYSPIQSSSNSTSAELYNTQTSASVTLPSPQAYSGWTALGWRDDKNTGAKEYSSGALITLTEDRDFYAVYSRTLTLSYNANGGSSTPSSQTATQYYNASGSKETKTFTLSSAITKTNSIFSGWSASLNGGTIYSAGSSISISDNTVLYAIWTDLSAAPAPSISLTDTDNGKAVTITSTLSGAAIYYTTDGSTPTTSSKLYSSPINISGITSINAIAVKDGYSASSVTSWTKPSYTVTYDYKTNGGSSATKASDSVFIGDTADLSPAATKSGWSFVGWNTDKSAKAALSEYTVTEGITLYAIYKKNLNAICYSPTLSLSSVSSAVIYNNEASASVILPSPQAYSGWTALGWRDDKNTGAKEYSSGSLITLTEDRDFYAVYSRNLTLSYNANGGTSTPSSQTATQYYNASGSKETKTFTLSSATSKPSSSFEGWAQNSPEGKIYAAGDNISISEDTVMYAVWDTGFTAASNGYSFGNTASAFGYLSVSKENYPISYDAAKIIFGGFVKGKQAYKYLTAYDWNGNCCGMVSTASLFGAGTAVTTDEYGKSDIYSLGINSASEKYTLKTFIEAMQIAQYAEQFSSAHTSNTVWCYDLAQGSDLNKLYNQIKSDTENNRYTVLTINKNKDGGHALLAGKVEDVSSTQSIISVYDPNFPGETRYMYITKNSFGDFTKWEYDLDGNLGVWGSESDKNSYYGISFIPYSVIEYIWKNRGNLNSSNQLLAVNSSNVSITNSNGIEIARVENGILHTESDLIFCAPKTTPGTDGATILYLPPDSYILQNTDDTLNLNASICGTVSSMSITTSASTVSFELDEIGGNSKMLVENAADTDTYIIEMDSVSSEGSDENTENITVSGTSNGLTSGLTSSNNNLSFVNTNIGSVSVNGIEQITHTITAAAGDGGKITPSGKCEVLDGAIQTFEITPTLGYEIENVTVDGISLGKTDSFTFSDITQEHDIYVSFAKKYAISDISFSSLSNTASVSYLSTEKAILALALYDSCNKLCDIKIKEVSGSTQEDFIFDCTASNRFKIKAFIFALNSAKPLCNTYERRID